MQKQKIKFIVSETTQMHDLVAEAYEALMDNESKEAIIALDKIAEKTRALKADLLIKEN